MTYQYDTNWGLLRTATCWSFTVVPHVLSSLEFWFFFTCHLGLHAIYRFGWLPDFSTHEDGVAAELLGLDWHFVKVISAMTTFFEVFYANHCYARYTYLYNQTRAMLDDTYAFAFLLRAILGTKGGKQYILNSIRYVMATMMLQASELKKVNSDEKLYDIYRAGLLGKAEIEALAREKHKYRATIVLSWASAVASLGCEAIGAPSNANTTLGQVLYRVRHVQQDIIDTLALPVPFQYFHLLSIMICMNLALWAYSMALTNSVFAPIVFFFAALIFVGMMELSSALSDPFGSDEVDFPIDEWVFECLESLTEIAESEYPGGGDSMRQSMEHEVCLRRALAHLSGDARRPSHAAGGATSPRGTPSRPSAYHPLTVWNSNLTALFSGDSPSSKAADRSPFSEALTLPVHGPGRGS